MCLLKEEFLEAGGAPRDCQTAGRRVKETFAGPGASCLLGWSWRAPAGPPSSPCPCDQRSLSVPFVLVAVNPSTPPMNLPTPYFLVIVVE